LAAALPGLHSVRTRGGWLGPAAGCRVRHLRAHSHARPQAFAQRRHRRRGGHLRTAAKIPGPAGRCQNKSMTRTSLLALLPVSLTVLSAQYPTTMVPPVRATHDMVA